MAARPLLTAQTITVVTALTDGEWAGIGTIYERTLLPPDELLPILARLEFWGWLEQKTVTTGDGTPISGARLRPSRLEEARAALDIAPESVDNRNTIVGWLGSQHSTFVAGVRDFLIREPEPAEPSTIPQPDASQGQDNTG